MTMTPNAESPRSALCVALFIPTYGDGGVERNFVYLANGLVAAGCPVTLMTCGDGGAFLDRLQTGVRRLQLRGSSDEELTAELQQILEASRPKIVMTGQQRDDAIALAAKERLVRSETRFFLNVGTPLSEQSKASHPFWLTRWLHRRKLHRFFDRCDGIIANSQGVARDLSSFLGIPGERIAVAPNPAISPDLQRLAAEHTGHPWLSESNVPVIMGAGRLSRVKDFPTLVRAFAKLRARQPCRLMILGSGRQKPRLERLARELGVEQECELTGFVNNPYAYLARAKAFVVSSLREGGPNVLMEALACGTPVVATDCPYGPREILDGGRFGALVPVGDADAMAEAIAETLKNPPSAELLQRAAKRYTVDNSARAYLHAFGLS